MKKLAFWILVLAALSLGLAAGASAEVKASGDCGENVKWQVDDTGTLTFSGTGPMEEYIELYDDGGWTMWSPPFWDWNKAEAGSTEASRRQIRKVVVKSGVTTIGGGALRDLDGLEEITIAGTVERIGAWSFHQDKALKTVRIPASVKSIGERAFYECDAMEKVNVASGNTAYKSVDGVVFTRDGKEMLYYPPARTASSYTVPAGVTLLHRSTFSYASALTEVTLPDGLVEIRDWAFGHTGLKRVDLPSSVKLVDYAAFGGCPLTDIYYDGTPAKWKKVVFDPSYDDYLLGCTIHFSDGTVDDTLTNLLSRGSCGDDLTWSVDKDGVLTIAGTGAMDNYAKYTHTIYDAWGREDRVESYYTYPWYDVSNRICAVRLEEGVESIGNMAFSEMETLQCISLPLSLESVVQGAFKGTGLKDVYYAGTEAQWSEVRRQWNNEPLNEAAFHFKSTDMPLPDFILWSYDSGTLRISGNGRMEDYAATKDSGKTWTFTSPPWWYWNSEGSAEENRSQINTVVVEGNVTYVGNGAFRDLENLEKVVLGDKVTDVGAFAFENDAKLEKVAIPAGVTQIADRAFYDCPKLTDLEVAGGNTAYKSVDGVLFTKDGSELVCYGAGRTAPEYRVPYGVTTLRPSAFSYNAALTGVTLPETLAEIGDWAFGHTGLKTVTLPASVKTLRHDAFGGCARLTKAYVAVGLATVREKAFDDSALKDVYYAGTEAQWDAVSVNSNNRGLLLATMHYGSSVKLAKKVLQLPADLKVIGPSAFEGGVFTHVYLGEKVKTIEARAFANCAELSCIFIPKATKSIANDAFIGCADVVIVCKADSAAQKYAEAQGINYLIEE